MLALLLPILLAAAQSVSGASPVPAAPAPHAPPEPAATMTFSTEAMLIASCDTDGDGVVTRAELDPCIARSFGRIAGTAPSFGYIDYSEWALRFLGNATALPSPFSVDANADNRITAAELVGYFDAAYARMDADHDGRLTRSELLTVRSGANGFGPPDDRRRRGRR